MKTIHCFTILALLTTSAVAASRDVVVHAQLVELSGDQRLPRDISKIAAKRGIDVFNSPKLTTRSGKAANLSLTRDFTVPKKGTFPIGLSVQIRPTLEAGRVWYSVDCDSTEFIGFAKSATYAPMFTTRKVVGVDGSTTLGQSAVVDLGSYDGQQRIQESGKPARTEIIRRQLYAILRFTAS